jgi:hypothetical protein
LCCFYDPQFWNLIVTLCATGTKVNGGDVKRQPIHSFLKYICNLHNLGFKVTLERVLKVLVYPRGKAKDKEGKRERKFREQIKMEDIKEKYQNI